MIDIQISISRRSMQNAILIPRTSPRIHPNSKTAGAPIYRNTMIAAGPVPKPTPKSPSLKALRLAYLVLLNDTSSG